MKTSPTGCVRFGAPAQDGRTRYVALLTQVLFYADLRSFSAYEPETTHAKPEIKDEVCVEGSSMPTESGSDSLKEEGYTPWKHEEDTKGALRTTLPLDDTTTQPSPQIKSEPSHELDACTSPARTKRARTAADRSNHLPRSS